MESRFSLIFALLSFAVVASLADLLPEEYWNSQLPNTSMPKAIKDLLSSEFLEGKSTSVNVGKGGVHVNTQKGKNKSGGTTVDVGKGGGVNVHTGRKGKPVYVGVKPSPNPFSYIYAATETQLHDDPNVALFFLENNLRPASKLTLHFPSHPTTSTFLPRPLANELPFSSNELPQILDHFSAEHASLEARSIEKTIKECEAPGIVGEDKYCATSLESMVDFATSRLAKKNNVEAISTELDREITTLQEFTVLSSAKKSTRDEAVVCHKMSYPYAVFYCHSTKRTRVYKVSLVGAGDGTKADAVAVCHTDTSAWNPKHLAFRVLKVRPGTVPVCHFLPQDHVVWVSKY